MSKNLSAKYFQKNKERPQKKARERQQNLSEKEKKWSNMTVNVPKNLSEDKKNLVEYRKKYKMRKNVLFYCLIERKYFNLENFVCKKVF